MKDLGLRGEGLGSWSHLRPLVSVEVEQHLLLQLVLSVADSDGVVVPVQTVDQRLCQGAGCRAQGSGLRFRAQGLGFRGQSLRVRV